MITQRIQVIILAFLGFTTATFCYASDEKPHPVIKSWGSLLAMDSVPLIKKAAEMKKYSGSQDEGIKEVPKSKKLAAPVAISAKTIVQPVKIIKPKIIKPVIKIK
jgi:hypothetical protein